MTLLGLTSTMTGATLLRENDILVVMGGGGLTKWREPRDGEAGDKSGDRPEGTANVGRLSGRMCSEALRARQRVRGVGADVLCGVYWKTENEQGAREMAPVYTCSLPPLEGSDVGGEPERAAYGAHTPGRSSKPHLRQTPAAQVRSARRSGQRRVNVEGWARLAGRGTAALPTLRPAVLELVPQVAAPLMAADGAVASGAGLAFASSSTGPLRRGFGSPFFTRQRL